MTSASAWMTRRIRSPSTEPGQRVFTRMPNSPTSMARVSDNPITAYLDAAYGDRIGNPVTPAVDEVNRIEPPPASRSMGTARRQHRKALRTFTAIVRSQPSTSRSSIGPTGPAIPTLAQSTSRPPMVATTSSNNSSTASASDTSMVLRSQPSGGSPATSATCTRAPSATKASAMARPIPEAPPVISTRCWSATRCPPFFRAGTAIGRREGSVYHPWRN